MSPSGEQNVVVNHSSGSWQFQKTDFFNRIDPQRARTFKLSNDPQFEEKFWDVNGLYLAPPDKALVLCCDEKSQIQALERTQPGLSLGIGYIQTKSHYYTRRHGTVTLFAALDYLQGKLISVSTGIKIGWPLSKRSIKKRPIISSFIC